MKLFDLLNEEEGQLILGDVMRGVHRNNYTLVIDALANRLPPNSDTRERLIKILNSKKSKIIAHILKMIKNEREKYYYNIWFLPGAVMMLRRLVPDWPELNIIYKSMKAEPDRYKKYSGQTIHWDD